MAESGNFTKSRTIQDSYSKARLSTQTVYIQRFISMNIAGLLSVLFALVLPSVVGDVHAISRRHDVSDSRYALLANSYPSVGKFNNGFSNGSGVLVAPQWVLTASHNLMFQSAPFTFEIGGESYRIDWSKRHFAALPHPYTASFNHDIALAHLERPVNHVAPAKLYFGNHEVGMVVTIVGYGMAGDGLHGVPIDPSQQQKRAGQNVIDATGNFDGHQVTVDRSGTLIFFDFDNPAGVAKAKNWFGGSDTPLALEGMSTSGDSGGGVFVETPAGTKLIGINSGVFPGVSAGESYKYGIISRNVRVSSFVGWVHETISKFESGNEPLKGLVAHWDFNDLSGGFAHDISGVGHRGNLVGVKPTKGILGGAVEFGSSGGAFRLPPNKQEYVDVPNETGAWNGVVANDLKIKKDITIAVWVYRAIQRDAGVSLATNIAPIVSKASLSNKKRDFSVSIWENHLRFYGAKGNYARSPTYRLPYGSWQHVATTRAGNSVKFYVNGKYIGQDRLVGEFPSTDNPVIIGNLPGTGWNFSGKLDDLRIYNRALSSEEVGLLADRNQING